MHAVVVAVSWWCHSTDKAWTWTWTPFPGIWVSVLVPAAVYAWAVLRRSPRSTRPRTVAFFAIGLLAYWAGTDWPLGQLGAGYLASIHMTTYLLYTLVAVPFMMMGTPEWMARRVLARLRLYRPTLWLSRSLVTCGLIYNVVLVSTHSPLAVDNLRANQFGSFAIDMAWLISGFALWLPIVAPLPEMRSRSYPAKMAYLFVAAMIMAIIPAGFLTFSRFPIYRTYELAPRVTGLNALEDQQIAGLLMKLATPPVVAAVIGVMWFRWYRAEKETYPDLSRT